MYYLCSSTSPKKQFRPLSSSSAANAGQVTLVKLAVLPVWEHAQWMGHGVCGADGVNIEPHFRAVSGEVAAASPPS